MSLSKGITLGAKYRSSVFGNWEKAIEISECIAHFHLASIQKVFLHPFSGLLALSQQLRFLVVHEILISDLVCLSVGLFVGAN